MAKHYFGSGPCAGARPIQLIRLVPYIPSGRLQREGNENGIPED